jgi:hypothetical protein
MARRRTTTTQRRPAKPLLASAKAVDVGSKAQVKLIEKRHQEWHPEAWALYRTVGEVTASLDYRASVISKVRIFAAVLPEETDAEPIPVAAGAEPSESDGETVPALISPALANLADDITDRLNGGQGVAALLSKISLNFDVPGECHVVGEPIDGEEEWRAYSDEELVTKNGVLRVIDDEGTKDGRPVDPNATIFRIWRPDPQKSWLSISSLRPIIEEGTFTQLMLLGKAQRSLSLSRFTNGIGLLRSGLDFPPPTPDGAGIEDDAPTKGGFQADLIAVASAAIETDGSPAAAAPYILEVDDPERDFKWITTPRTEDEKASEKYDMLLGRIANALPLPREMVLGLGESTNHWSAALIERSGFRAYIEPTVLAICHALTVGFFRPMLLGAGVPMEDVKRLVLWFDPEDALAPEDRVDTATKGVELGAIGEAAWRREAKFDESDKPTQEERLERLGFTRSQMTGELSLAILRIMSSIYPDLAKLPETLDPPEPDQGGPPPPVELPPAPDPTEPEENPVPMVASAATGTGDRLAAIDRGLTERIGAAADAAVEQALVRAGNRLRGMAKKDRAATSAIRDVEPERVASVLGRPWVLRLRAPAEDPDTVEDLLAGSFVALRERFVRQVRAAWAATTEEALLLALPEDRPSQVELDLLDAEAQEDIDRAADGLVVALTALASALLFDPSPEASPGEVNVNAIVPAVLIREALATAGGATVERTSAGGLTTTSGPPGGVATGDRSRTLFARIRAWWTGYRWDYGDASTRARPFLPHKALDGRSFTRWDSPELANTDAEWMGTLTLSPGDHRGCQCAFTPIVIQPAAAEEAA